MLIVVVLGERNKGINEKNSLAVRHTSRVFRFGNRGSPMAQSCRHENTSEGRTFREPHYRSLRATCQRNSGGPGFWRNELEGDKPHYLILIEAGIQHRWHAGKATTHSVVRVPSSYGPLLCLPRGCVEDTELEGARRSPALGR